MSDKADYPFYDGQPVEISAFGWLALVGSVFVAIALLMALPFQSFPLARTFIQLIGEE